MPPNSADADIGDALRHQLAIGAMTASGHAVGHHRRQQRFDRAEQREGDRVGQHGGRLRERERRQAPATAVRAECRRSACRWFRPAATARHVATAASTTAIRMPGQDGRQRRRPAMMAMLTIATATADGLTVCRPPRRAPRVSARIRPAPSPGSVIPNEIPELAGEDDDGDAGGEADRHRIGNELDVGAEPQEARGDQEHARHQRRQDHAVDAVTLDGRRHQHDEGAGGPADLEPAAAEQRRR